jgi:peptidyl-prolyl cis-trans isomerase SurA
MFKRSKRENNFDQERIEDKELTFADAARKFSDEKETRANGGAFN